MHATYTSINTIEVQYVLKVILCGEMAVVQRLESEYQPQSLIVTASTV